MKHRFAGIPAGMPAGEQSFSESVLLVLRVLPTNEFKMSDVDGSLLSARFSRSGARLPLPTGTYYVETLRLDRTGAIVGVDALLAAEQRSCDIECTVYTDGQQQSVAISLRRVACQGRCKLIAKEVGEGVVEFRSACVAQ